MVEMLMYDDDDYVYGDDVENGNQFSGKYPE